MLVFLDRRTDVHVDLWDGKVGISDPNPKKKQILNRSCWDPQSELIWINVRPSTISRDYNVSLTARNMNCEALTARKSSR